MCFNALLVQQGQDDDLVKVTRGSTGWANGRSQKAYLSWHCYLLLNDLKKVA